MKKTRDTLFRETFEFYLDHVRRRFDIPNLVVDDLLLLTTNTRSAVHDYLFVIPNKYIQYHVDVPYPNEMGEMVPPGPVYKYQEKMPTYFNLLVSFEEFFGTYRAKNFETNEVIAGCCIRIDEPENSENNIDEIGGMRFAIMVKYDANYVSYPPSIPTVEQELLLINKELQEKIMFLQEDIIDNYKIIYNDRAYIRELVETIDNQRKSAAIKILGMYSKLEETGQFEDCPVCYEKITKPKLCVPLCCHFICSECSSKCGRCPICRGEF
jgi:hypothetical protein